MKRLTHLLVIVLMVLFFDLGISLADGPPVQWQKTFGGSDDYWGTSVQKTTDGGYIIAGTIDFSSPGDRDVYLLKVNSDGNIQWQMTFGGSYVDLGHSVQQTADGGYVIAGETESFGAGSADVYLIKTKSDGNIQWEKTFGGIGSDEGRSVQQTVDGGYIIAGSSGGDVYLIKTDPNGNSEWEKSFGGNGPDEGRSVQQTTDGGYIIAGAWWQALCCWPFIQMVGDVYLIKTDPTGNRQWEKIFGRTNHTNGGNKVQQTIDGGYVITGKIHSDVYLVKTDPDGNKEWEKRFGGSSYEWGHSVQQTADGGYVIAGGTESFGAGSYDVYLIKTDSDGKSKWEKTFGGSSVDRGYSVHQTADSGYIIAGTTESYCAGSSDVYLIKLCSEGTLAGDLNCDGTVNYEDVEILVSQWLQPRSTLYPHADIYGVGDGIVNFLDYAAQTRDDSLSKMQARNPNPVDGAIIPGGEIEYPPDSGNWYIWTYLIFDPGPTAVKHTAYFNDDYSKVYNRHQDANLGSPPFSPYQGWEYTYLAGNPEVAPATDSLVRGTTYYWCVDETDADGHTFPGVIWELTIQGFYATKPNPPNDAMLVDPNVVLSWGEGHGVQDHDIYFGTSWDDVNNADANDATGIYRGFESNPQYQCNDLEYLTTYYWRVDEVQGRFPPLFAGIIYKGDVWSFTTKSSPPP